MNKIFVSILLLIVGITVQAQPVAKVKDFMMKSKYFNHEREVLIYTPVGYEGFTATDYDVMYVFDSNERSKFDLVHCLPDFISLDATKHFIVVGICSPNLEDIGYLATPTICQCLSMQRMQRVIEVCSMTNEDMATAPTLSNL